jgi:crotonobetainyl-CoA:carnitine CoA-transferase CaiB-like acyl-CoA transferase
MTDARAGIKVVELAGWTFVPSAGAVLADWGADVIKIEHPETGDPQRGLNVGALGTSGPGGVSFILEQPNRGKRSLGVNVGSEEGRALLLKLVAQSDVFLTNFLPDSLQRLRLTVEDVRAANPKIIYARGTGYGVRGEEANKGGFDSAVYWSRAGIAEMLSTGDSWPPFQRPAFGDVMGGLSLAGGISAALFKLARTGEPSVVDVSLLSLGAWNMAPDLVAQGLLGDKGLIRFTVDDMPNPLMNYYRTADGRMIQLMMLQADRFWPDVCRILERPDLLTDPRFANAPARFEHRIECIVELRKAFAARPLNEWKERLSTTEGVWAVLQNPAEVIEDPQIKANGYLRPVTTEDGSFTYNLVANPIQFDETPPELTRAPDHGQQTDEILLELGLDWDEIIELKTTSVVL